MLPFKILSLGKKKPPPHRHRRAAQRGRELLAQDREEQDGKDEGGEARQGRQDVGGGSDGAGGRGGRERGELVGALYHHGGHGEEDGGSGAYGSQLALSLMDAWL